MQKKKEALPVFHSCYTINLRWILDLYVKGPTIMLLEENLEEYLHEIAVDKDVLGHKMH